MRKYWKWLALCAALNLVGQSAHGEVSAARYRRVIPSEYQAPVRTPIVNADSAIPPVPTAGSIVDDGYQISAPSTASASEWSDVESCSNDGWAIRHWLANTQAITGVDAYKSLGDSSIPPGPSAGYMNSAGVFGGLNSGFGLGGSRIRGQLGGTYGVYDFKGRDTVNFPPAEQQSFITGGIYKRSNFCDGDRIAWGLVYDQFWADQWGLNASEVYLGQVRGMSGFALNEQNEIGTWATVHTTQDSITPGIGLGDRIRASNQTNVYWKHSYAFGGTTTAYAGGVDHADIGSWIAGLSGVAPLSCHTSLFGNSTFLFPSSASGQIGSNEMQWNVSMGLVYSFGGKAMTRNVSGQAGLPLMPVANNGSFLITN